MSKPTPSTINPELDLGKAGKRLTRLERVKDLIVLERGWVD
jgi:hypothetical protein